MKRFLPYLRFLFLFTAAAACSFLLYAVWHAPVFAAGETYTFYSESNSSAPFAETDEPVLTKLLIGSAAGESVVYTGNCCEWIMETYRARLLFTEQVCGVTAYYCYSPLLKGGVWLNGCLVNLHVAVDGERTSAGTPLIFGGY